MSKIPHNSNKSIHDALRVLARDIQSDDGVANVAIAEAADRISELGKENERLHFENAALREDKARLDWLKKCLEKDLFAAIDAARKEAQP